MRNCPEHLQGNHQGFSRRNTHLPHYTCKVCSLGLYWLCICNSFIFSLPLRFMTSMKVLFKNLSTTSWGSFSPLPLQWSGTDMVTHLTRQRPFLCPVYQARLALRRCEGHRVHVSKQELSRPLWVSAVRVPCGLHTAPMNLFDGLNFFP